jgi:hypothetical protein
MVQALPFGHPLAGFGVHIKYIVALNERLVDVYVDGGWDILRSPIRF